MRLGGRLTTWIALSLSLTAAPAAVHGQGGGQAHVEPVQDLQFGQLIPGAQTRVDPADAGRRGELRLEGRGTYQLQFALPTEMVSGSGGKLPVSFGSADGVLVRGSAGGETAFDPSVGTTLVLSRGVTEARVFIGGTARPTASQAAGIYSANITVLMAQN